VTIPLYLRVIGILFGGLVGVLGACFFAWLRGGTFGLGDWWWYLAVFLAAALYVQFTSWLDDRSRARQKGQEEKSQGATSDVKGK